MRTMAYKNISRILVMVTLSLYVQIAGAQNSHSSQAETYGRLPLTFESNQGQAPSQAKFLVRGRGYTTYLTTGGMVLSLRSKQSATGTPKGANSGPGAASNRLEIRLQGASSNPAAVGEAIQPGIVNYFIGRDPSNWRTGIPTYARVRYTNVYPGIDLVYHGNHQQLEYDFELKPGSTPDQIGLEIRGAKHVALDASGNLMLTVTGGTLQVQCPVVYQISKGQRVSIKGTYVMKDRTHVGFSVSQYDRNQALVIDPVLVYSTYLGGSGLDVAGGMAVDASGNLYVTGYTDSADFAGTADPLPGNANHAFVSKIDPSGSSVIYTDYIGGNGQDYGVGLVLDSSNEAYITGSTTSSDFPTVSAYQPQQPGPYSGFLTHISQDGSSLLYSTYLGGSTFDQPTSIAINTSGQVYVAGYTMSRNYPVVNAYQSSVSPNGGGNYGGYGFVTKFNQSGSSLAYSTYLAGNSNVIQSCGSSSCWPQPYSVVSAISLDANDNAYLTGTTNTYNFPTTSGVYASTNSTSGNAYVGYVTKLTSNGEMGYSTYFYESSGNPIAIASIAVDGSGSAYITGTADSDGTFPATTTSLCDPGVYGFDCSYAFVTKFDPAGSTLLYSTFLGPYNYASPQSILLDSKTDAYVLASTSDPDFQTLNSLQGYNNGLDVLLVEINPDATAQLFSTYLGGSGDESPSGMALDADENVYIAGTTSSADLTVSQGAFQNQFGGNTDAFLAKIFTGTAPLITVSPTSLQFASTAVGSSSQALSVQVQNLSPVALSISSISVTGDFTQTNTCGSTVAANGSCTLAVKFAPTATGTRTGSLVLNDNAAGGSQTVTLQGSGTGASVSLSSSALVFSVLSLGSTSAAQSVTLTNQGNSSLSISSVQISGDFSQINSCGSSLGAGSQCVFQILFSPKATGVRTGSLVINDNASGSPQSVLLSGTGSDFSLTASPSSATVSSGSTATYTLLVNSVGGSFGNSVALACSQVPSQATCKLSPSSATPGAKGSSITVTISTAGSSSSFASSRGGHDPINYAAWIQFQNLGLAGLAFIGGKWRRKKWLASIGVALILLLLLFAVGCAGGTGIAQQTSGSKTTASGTYTILLSGTSGTLKHSTNLTLVVQ